MDQQSPAPNEASTAIAAAGESNEPLIGAKDKLEELAVNTIRFLAVDAWRRPSRATPARRWAWPHGLRHSGRSSSATIPPTRTGRTATASSSPPVMPRCCSTRCLHLTGYPDMSSTS